MAPDPFLSCLCSVSVVVVVAVAAAAFLSVAPVAAGDFDMESRISKRLVSGDGDDNDDDDDDEEEEGIIFVCRLSCSQMAWALSFSVRFGFHDRRRRGVGVLLWT